MTQTVSGPAGSPDSLAERRRESDRHRVSATFLLPLDLIRGNTYDEMWQHAAATLEDFNRRS